MDAGACPVGIPDCCRELVLQNLDLVADSRRTVPFPAPCVEALREHRKRQFAERSDAWPDWEEHDLVFPSRRGTPMEPDNLRRSWYAIRQAAGLGQTRFHDLRHTCVTLLLDLGAPPHVGCINRRAASP
jgi:integrase